MKIYPFHLRMAELYLKGKTETLTTKEIKEMFKCHEANVDMCYKIGNLYELSYQASMTNDSEWLHDICRQIQAIELT